MKKYIIIAAAALFAAAACSEVENKLETPEEAISFKVVDYSAATRADGDPTSLIDEGYKQFTTFAWIHADGAQTGTPFMNAEIIKPNNETNPTEWAPSSRPYYWPKSETSYINFFSFAGTKVPATMSTEGEVTIADVTVEKTSNILVADAAYGYKKNTNPAKYGAVSGVSEGVPTLFRHMLAQVYFDVKLDATVVDDAKYKFTAVINELTLTAKNTGSISLKFTAPATTPGESKFASEKGWELSGDPASLEKTENVTLTANGKAASEFSKLMDWSSVMPQALSVTTDATGSTPATTTDNVFVTFKYTLTTQYDTNAPYNEVITVSNVPLSKFTPTVTKWDMNTRYTYHITINPVSGEKILFDPAVEAWVDGGEHSYTYPEATTTTSTGTGA